MSCRTGLPLSGRAPNEPEQSVIPLAGLSTASSTDSELRQATSFMLPTTLPARSTGSAAVSRSVEGPSNGSTTYGPGPTPQTLLRTK